MQALFNVEARDELEDLLQNRRVIMFTSHSYSLWAGSLLGTKGTLTKFLQTLAGVASCVPDRNKGAVQGQSYEVPPRRMSATKEEMEKAEHNLRLLGEGVVILSCNF